MSATVSTRELGRALTAEFLGTAFLLISVVGSGIMAERLSDDVGIQLLQNSVATAGALVALILTFGAVSGAHFNPAVTICEWLLGKRTPREVAGYVVAQVTGAVVGVMISNVMFDLAMVNLSEKTRGGVNLVASEAVATLGLLLVVFGVSRAHGTAATAVAVGSYIGGAYAFTSSTSFANPAVSVARMLSDTFAGIAPKSVPAFVAVQLVVAVAAVPLVGWLFSDPDLDDDSASG